MNLKLIIDNINHYFEDNKKVFYIFLTISTLNSVLEFFSLLSLVIILQILLNSLDSSLSLIFLENLMNYFNQQTLLILAIFFLIFKNIFFLIFFRYFTRFLTKVFTIYIENYYNFLNEISYYNLIKLQTSKILNHIPRNIESVFSKYFFALGYILSDILTIIIIVIYILSLYSLQITLVFIPFFILFFIIYLLIKKIIENSSKLRIKIYEDIINYVRFSLEFGDYFRLSEIRIISKKIFENKVNKLKKPFLNIYYFNNFTRSFYELSAIILVLSFTFVIYKLNPTIEIINTLGIICLSLIRFLPNLSRLNSQLFSLKGVSADIIEIKNQYSHLKNIEKKQHVEIKNISNKTDQKLIILQNIKFLYEKDKYIFNNFNFQFNKNINYVFYGPSGSGKSSLGLIISGLLHLDYGSVEFRNFKSNRAEDIINYVPQMNYMMNNSLLDNITYTNNYDEIDNDKLHDSLNFSCLDKLLSANNLKQRVYDYGNNFSGGQNRRLILARGFYNKKDVNIFDEPTSSLDEQTANQIIENIPNFFKDKINIIFTHDKNFMQNTNYEIINLENVK